MQNKLPRLLILIVLLSSALSFLLPDLASSASPTRTFIYPKTVNVSASVGEFKLNLSGWMSPYANIVLTSNGIFMASTVADKAGNWSFSDILINHGFSQFCLTAIDFYRLGESETPYFHL